MQKSGKISRYWKNRYTENAWYTTESINLVAFSFGEAFIREGDEILVTEMEHHANIVPWQMLCERKGAVLKVLPFNDKGELDLSQLDTLLTPRVKLVGVAYVSNVLGPKYTSVVLLIKKSCSESV